MLAPQAVSRVKNLARPAGHIDVAAAALRDVRRAQPTFRLLGCRRTSQIDREHYLEAFRCAGLD